MITISESDNYSISLNYQSQHDEFYFFLISLERPPFYAEQEYTFDKASIDSFLQSSQYLEINNTSPISLVSLDLDFSMEFNMVREDTINVVASFYGGEKGFLQSFFTINKQSFFLLARQLKDILYGGANNGISKVGYPGVPKELEADNLSSAKELVLYDSNRNIVLTLQAKDNLGMESFYLIIDNPPFSLHTVLPFNKQSLNHFIEDVSSIYNREKTSIALKSSDALFSLAITSNIYLHMNATITFESKDEGRLVTYFDFDQSYLPELICQISKIIAVH